MEPRLPDSRLFLGARVPQGGDSERVWTGSDLLRPAQRSER